LFLTIVTASVLLIGAIAFVAISGSLREKPPAQPFAAAMKQADSAQYRGDLKLAAESYQQLIAETEQAGNKLLCASATQELATIYARQNNSDAQSQYEHALALFKEAAATDDPTAKMKAADGCFRSAWGLATFEHKQQLVEPALASYKAAAGLITDVVPQEEQSQFYLEYSGYMRERGDKAGADRLQAQADRSVDSCFGKGLAALMKHDYSKSKAFYSQAQTLCDRKHDLMRGAIARTNLALCALRENDRALFDQMIDQAFAVSKQIKEEAKRKMCLSACYSLVAARSAIDNHDKEALEALNTAIGYEKQVPARSLFTCAAVFDGTAGSAHASLKRLESIAKAVGSK
jgi:tetratricopeptide (TPR) repeat protein